MKNDRFVIKMGIFYLCSNFHIRDLCGDSMQSDRKIIRDTKRCKNDRLSLQYRISPAQFVAIHRGMCKFYIR